MSRYSWIDPEWRDLLAGAGLRDLDALLQDADEPRLPGRWDALNKPGLNGRQRWRWQIGDSAGRTLFVKRYFRTPLREQVDRIQYQRVGHGRAWWEYETSRRLAEAQVPSVRVVGVVERMHGPFERSSAVLFEQAPGEPFDRVWPRLEAAGAPVTRGPARIDVAIRLGRLICAFHQTGFCHRDLYLCHIFSEIDASGAAAPRFAIIDLARALRPTARRGRWVLKDLSQLDASARQIGATRSDRVRFLLAYLGLQPGAPRTRWYARRVAQRSDRILRRIARHARRDTPSAAMSRAS
ncbi:MAG: hypothetical protein JNG88_00380 [Phycisphaerales bacterium]|nr:hypothetical protein [Phycisphaerales bacterium]